jgi:hypothetical protein
MNTPIDVLTPVIEVRLREASAHEALSKLTDSSF